MNDEEEEHLGHGELAPGQKFCQMFGSFVYCSKETCSDCIFGRDRQQ